MTTPSRRKLLTKYVIRSTARGMYYSPMGRDGNWDTLENVLRRGDTFSTKADARACVERMALGRLVVQEVSGLSA